MTANAPGALFSIHDVMPETLDAVAALLDMFAAREQSFPALLVVPGRDWRNSDLQRLRGWESEGAELVAHGWRHETQPRRLFHRLHSLALSRNVAEHLDLDAHGVCELMERSHQWFVDQGFRAPGTYIPPAWALGLPKKRLGEQPFDCIEVLGGVYLRRGARFEHHRLPLMGFEADTTFRAMVLRFWNRRQRSTARGGTQPVRIAIHPQDASLLLKTDLGAILDERWRPIRYAQLTA